MHEIDKLNYMLEKFKDCEMKLLEQIHHEENQG